MEQKLKKKITSFLLFVTLIATVLLLLPTQHIQATGPALIEGTDGFAVNQGENLTYTVTAWDADWTWSLIDRLGYKYDYYISAANNSFRSVWGWYADSIFHLTRLLNTTSGTWLTLFGGEKYLSGYNSTDPSFGYYFRTATINMWWPVIPLNISAANRSIVYNTEAYMDFLHGDPGTVQHSVPSGLPGTWTLWNGSGDNDNSWKITYTYNTRGILTKMSWYGNGTSWGDWRLKYEWTLSTFPIPIELLLLAAMPQPGLLDMLLDPMMLIIIGMGIIIIILIIALAKK